MFYIICYAVTLECFRAVRWQYNMCMNTTGSWWNLTKRLRTVQKWAVVPLIHRGAPEKCIVGTFGIPLPASPTNQQPHRPGGLVSWGASGGGLAGGLVERLIHTQLSFKRPNPIRPRCRRNHSNLNIFIIRISTLLRLFFSFAFQQWRTNLQK